jgi:hypothetical protein
VTDTLDLAALERRREYAIEQWREGDSDLVYDFVRDDVLTLLDRLAGVERPAAIDRHLARIAALEAAVREVVDDLRNGDTTNCPTCGAMLVYQEHGRGCSLVALAALLDGAP